MHQLPTNHHSLCTALQAATAGRNLLGGQQLHAHILKFNTQTTTLTNHLINFYSKCHLPYFSNLVFQKCPSSATTKTTFSSLISSFTQNNLPHLSLQSLLHMLRSGLLPDNRTLPSAAKACGMTADPQLGCSIHSLVVKIGIGFDVYVGSSLVDMYAKCGWVWDARKVFDEMPERNVVTWSGLICGYSQLGLLDECLTLFKRALLVDDGARFDICVNDFSYSGIIRVCGEATVQELGCQVHGHCVRTGFDSSSFVGGSLITMYSKCGVVEDGYKVFDELPNRNLGVWNAMLFACAQHGHSKKAFDCFDQMCSSGMTPNFITFLHLLYACSHAGLVEDGKMYFNLMVKNHNIEAGFQHYVCMVDLLGRAGKLKDAMEFITKMPMEPSDTVWAALLTGCRIHNDTTMAKFAAARLQETNSHSSGPLMLLCNTFTASGNYEAAAEARKAMRDKGVRKETGVSWVEFGNQIHIFVSCDRWHERSEEIYRKLEDVEEEMGKFGYASEIREVGCAEDDKKRVAGWHSERLAAAWWLVAVEQKERPIKVMKNLRVCGDCHIWFKLLTTCTGRIVILRDNSRFHRFVDGVCSCADYW